MYSYSNYFTYPIQSPYNPNQYYQPAWQVQSDYERQQGQFQSLSRRVNELERRVNQLNRQVNQLEQTSQIHSRRLNRLNQRLRVVEQRLHIPFTAQQDGY